MLQSSKANAQREAREEGRSRLEVSREEVDEPVPERAERGRFRLARYGVNAVEQMFESRSHALPVDANERVDAQVLLRVFSARTIQRAR